MTGTIAALRTALDDDDARAAREAIATLRSGGRTDDDVLDLLARRAGDRPLAVELLVESIDETGLVRAAVARVLIDETSIDDVSQDVLIAVARSVGGFRGDARFTTWLFELARNRAIDHLRRQRQEASLGDRDVSEVERMSSIIATRESARALVQRLPETYRKAVWLRELEQLSYAEVASQLQMNENTVRSRVARGRALLATYLAPAGGEHDASPTA